MTPPPSIIPDWRQTLRDAGLPEAVVIIDFEQYFTTEYSLRKMSAWEYVTDSRYEELGRSIKHVPAGSVDGPTEWSWGDYRNPIIRLQELYGPHLEGCTVVAHNLAYDGLILYLKYGIHIPNAVDILGLARHENSQADNSLDAIAKRLGFPPKGKTSEFKDLHLAECFESQPDLYGALTPNEKGRKLEAYANRDVDIEWLALKYYLPRWSNVKMEAWLMRHTLGLYWEPKIVINRAEGDNIRDIMQVELDSAIKASGCDKSLISSTNGFRDHMLEAITRAGDDPASYIKLGKRKKNGDYPRNLAAAKTDPQHTMMLEHRDPTVRALMTARVAVKSWPNHIKRIERIKSMSAAAGGKMPIPLKYHGAHTGRWSGGDGVNLQNLGSRGLDIVTRIRGMLEAPAGYKLIVVDLAAIEACVLAWLAEQWDLCDKFDRHIDVYSEFASSVLGWSVRKPRADDPKPLADRYKYGRNAVGKTGILGFGYGMGDEKAVTYAGGAIDGPMAKAMVTTYRTQNAMIVKYWGTLERAFKAAAQHGIPAYLPHGVCIYKEGDAVNMRLPSGRILRYNGIYVTQSPRGRGTSLVIPACGNGTKKTHTWGGSLAENITQAVARDILGEAVQATEFRGHRVVLHCHDEIVACVPDSQAQQALDDIVGIFRTKPSWAARCPLDAEGSIMERYGK